uniref:Uncharacterized protein n=1 Tax=Sphaeramia orbicularis TaxID=375764 RepID=A0A673BIW2_9TELE
MFFALFIFLFNLYLPRQAIKNRFLFPNAGKGWGWGCFLLSALYTKPSHLHVASVFAAAQCVFEGRHYSLGEAWMDNACMQCTLNKHPVVHRPVDFPAWCEVRVEPVTCKVSLVQTADPRLPCVPGETNRDPSHGSLFTPVGPSPLTVHRSTTPTGLVLL